MHSTDEASFGPVAFGGAWKPSSQSGLRPAFHSEPEETFDLTIECECGAVHKVELPLSWSRKTIERFLRRQHFGMSDDLRDLLENWPPRPVDCN